MFLTAISLQGERPLAGEKGRRRRAQTQATSSSSCRKGVQQRMLPVSAFARSYSPPACLPSQSLPFPASASIPPGSFSLLPYLCTQLMASR